VNDYRKTVFKNSLTRLEYVRTGVVELFISLVVYGFQFFLPSVGHHKTEYFKFQILPSWSSSNFIGTCQLV
jgi:hypothetical protein